MKRFLETISGPGDRGMNELLRGTNLCAALHLAQSGLQTFLPGLSVKPREAASRLTTQLAIAVASSPCWMLIATPGGRDDVSDKTEASYRHGTAIEKRRKLMASWTEFCRSPPVTKIGKVVPIRGHQ